jgi:hypothetical protein
MFLVEVSYCGKFVCQYIRVFVYFMYICTHAQLILKTQVQVQVFTQRPRNGRIKLCNCANREILKTHTSPI